MSSHSPLAQWSARPGRAKGRAALPQDTSDYNAGVAGNARLADELTRGKGQARVRGWGWWRKVAVQQTTGFS